MLDLFVSVLTAIRSLLRTRGDQALEILALRQQLAIYKRVSKRPKLRAADRVLWVWLSKLWGNWRNSLVIVKPETASTGTSRVSSSTGLGCPDGREAPAALA